jgi:hypothetical protein
MHVKCPTLTFQVHWEGFDPGMPLRFRDPQVAARARPKHTQEMRSESALDTLKGSSRSPGSHVFTHARTHARSHACTRRCARASKHARTQLRTACQNPSPPSLGPRHSMRCPSARPHFACCTLHATGHIICYMLATCWYNMWHGVCCMARHAHRSMHFRIPRHLPGRPSRRVEARAAWNTMSAQWDVTRHVRGLCRARPPTQQGPDRRCSLPTPKHLYLFTTVAWQSRQAHSALHPRRCARCGSSCERAICGIVQRAALRR